MTSKWLAAIVACAAAAAGCGAASGGGGSPCVLPSLAATADQTPQQRAAADAAAILACFVPPPGAQRLPGNPVQIGIAGAAGGPLVSPDIVDDDAWWGAPLSPRMVLAWEEAHLPRQFAASGVSGPVLLTEQWSLPAEPGVLDSRELLVNVFDLRGGQSAIYVNAEVRWR